jgi:hypothetical protein
VIGGGREETDGLGFRRIPRTRMTMSSFSVDAPSMNRWVRGHSGTAEDPSFILAIHDTLSTLDGRAV